MIGPQRPGWRGRGVLYIEAALLLTTVAGASGEASAPFGESYAAGALADGAGLVVSEIDSMEIAGTNPTHLQVWVDVTNPGSDPATSLTAEMRGADPAIVLGDESYTHEATVSRGGSTTETFEVIPRTILTVSARISSNSPLGSIGLSVTSPGGNEYAGTPSNNGAEVTVPRADVDAGVFGGWSATVTHTGGLRSISYTFTTSFEYTDATDNLSLAQLPPGETYRFYYNIWAQEPDTTIPPGMTITVNGTVVEGGVETRVSYLARVGGPVEEQPGVAQTASGGGALAAVAVAVFVTVILGATLAWGRVRRGWRAAKLLEALRPRPLASETVPATEKPE